MNDFAIEELVRCKLHLYTPKKQWHYKSGGYMIWCPQSKCIRIIDNYQTAIKRWNKANE